MPHQVSQKADIGALRQKVLCKPVTACSADGTVLMELESYHRAEIWLLETGRSDKVDTHSYISRIARMNRDAGQLKYSYKGIYWK